MTHAPKVTVFIPVYNRERYVKEAIDSILAQTYPDFELLLIDDGSTDDSVAVIESYKDPRIRLERNEHNVGIPRTRNRGLELARGEYVAMLDSDDAAYPERLAKQVAFLDAHPDYAAIGSWGRAMDGAGRPHKTIKRQPVDVDEVKAHLLFRCCINNRSMTGRTAMLREFGYRNDFPRCQDYDLLANLAVKHKLGNLPEVLVLGRVHDQQITGQTVDLGQAKKQEIARRQLRALGVEAGEEDLRRHAILGRLAKLDHRPDREFLEWAERWLRKLEDANQITSIYAEPIFSRVLGSYWMKACRRSSTAALSTWTRFLRSPLRRGAGHALARQALGRY